jgi:hypothetical protein
MSMVMAGITRPQDFTGKSIRVATDLLSNLHAMTTPVGLTLNQFMEVILPSDLTQFASGKILVWGAFLDGLAITTQNVDYLLIILFPDSYGVHFYGDSVFITNELISENPDLVVRSLKATLKG